MKQFAQSPVTRVHELYDRERRYCADLELRSVEECERFGRYLLTPYGHWRPYTWIEVVTLRRGVLVHGDCQTCLFSGVPDHGPRGPLYWQARVNPDYGAQKANRGETQHEEWNAECAAYYVLGWRRQKDIDKDVARELYDGLRSLDWSQHEFVQACYDNDVDGEDIANASSVVSWNVINAQCVLMHLVRLLERRDFQQQARDWLTREAA